MDIRSYNQNAWDRNVDQGNEFTLPVDSETIRAAREGHWRIALTPVKPVPPAWFPPLAGLDVLCLASGGGQQGPVLSAAGARVTVFDISPKQLAQDRLVAEREALEIVTVQGDMRNLSVFQDGSFDLIAHPVSNLFIPNVHPVWQECYRVLRPGGLLLAGFMNPVFYLFDRNLMDEQGILKVAHSIPYSDLTDQSPSVLQNQIDQGWALEFGHTLEDQIGGQLEAGFQITGFYEDRDPRCVLDDYLPVYIVTRSVKG